MESPPSGLLKEVKMQVHCASCVSLGLTETIQRSKGDSEVKPRPPTGCSRAMIIIKACCCLIPEFKIVLETSWGKEHHRNLLAKEVVCAGQSRRGS